MTNESYCFAYRTKITCVEKIKNKFKMMTTDDSCILHEEFQFEQQNLSLLSFDQKKKKVMSLFSPLCTDKTCACVSHSR